ncbi:GNAT family N-acetyltransferase [Microbacterium excoecariae]|uniref:GNAT family N-acetyltransferase n=1 Tax=Microbacterium excoecariae TaxID=2715210 RepID=UPI00140725B6|nr:GNAT family N-acetyltransferase [Microbacterium excoecariae]NHI16419.1 GNAT family N-acetyltransferase [Microbacterium excoecariae]
MSSSEPAVRTAPLAELDPGTLYEILRLRVDVFVVEQECPYPELDGRDAEPGAVLAWIEARGAVAATVRILREAFGWRIGRVATRRDARGHGLAATLMRHAVAAHAGEEIVLDAQAHLAGWYGRFGFAVSGEEFLEDGIPHVPMRRPADGSGQAQGS